MKVHQEQLVLEVSGALKSFQSKCSHSNEDYLKKKIFRCLLGQHPRIRWNRKRRSAVQPRRHIPFFQHYKFQRNNPYVGYLFGAYPPPKNIFLPPINILVMGRRFKRALKGEELTYLETLPNLYIVHFSGLRQHSF